MTTVTGLTAARMAEIEAASVVSGEVVNDDLILTKFDDSTINAGNVRGPQGEVGDDGADGVGIPAGGTEGQILVKSDAVDYNVEWQTFLRHAAVTTQISQYTLVMDDLESVVMIWSETAKNVTVPLSTGGQGVDFPVGTTIRILQAGEGAVTIVGANGVTVLSVEPWTFTTAGLGALVELIKVGTDTWVLNGMGNLTTTVVTWTDWVPNITSSTGAHPDLGNNPVQEGRYCIDSLNRLSGFATVRWDTSGYYTNGGGYYYFKLPAYGKNQDPEGFSPIGTVSLGTNTPLHKTGLLHFDGWSNTYNRAMMAIDEGLFGGPQAPVVGTIQNAHWVFEYQYDPTP